MGIWRDFQALHNIKKSVKTLKIADFPIFKVKSNKKTLRFKWFTSSALSLHIFVKNRKHLSIIISQIDSATWLMMAWSCKKNNKLVENGSHRILISIKIKSCCIKCFTKNFYINLFRNWIFKRKFVPNFVLIGNKINEEQHNNINKNFFKLKLQFRVIAFFHVRIKNA